MTEREQYLKKASERFRETLSELREAVRKVSPNTKEVFEWGMPGFRIKITKKDIKEWKGTIDPNYIHIFLVERKAGTTLHIWNPSDYYWLDRKKKDLMKAGFKVMRGCLQWNKKEQFPIGQIEKLFNGLVK